MLDADKLIDFNIWANRRILDQVKRLSKEMFIKELGGSFPSIRLTLLHMLESDWIWMNRWKGFPLVESPKEWSTDSADAIDAIWSTIHMEMKEIGRGLAIRPQEEIRFTTRKGASLSLPFLDIVIHVTNHGTYHRGQVVNMLRMLGETPVNTDYFIYYTSTRN